MRPAAGGPSSSISTRSSTTRTAGTTTCSTSRLNVARRRPVGRATTRRTRGVYLNDFRVGSVLQSKLECVLEKMVAENPHMAGFFADDLGSRSWYPGFSWDTWGTTNQQSYRAGAIALRRLCGGSQLSTG